MKRRDQKLSESFKITLPTICEKFQICMGKSTKAQISTEYVIVISFVLFFVLTALGIGLSYSSEIQNTLKFNQIESFADKITSQAETIFYAGYPSRTTVKGYLPEGVQDIWVQGNYLVFNVTTNAGLAITAFRSNVNLTGDISSSSGVKVVYLNASTNAVILSG